jgi:putative mRNA 3-end processing factor
VHWCQSRGLKARPLDIAGYGDEEEDAESNEAEA